MRRSCFRVDDVYAHVQRLPPQTRTYYNEQHSHIRMQTSICIRCRHNELRSQQTLTHIHSNRPTTCFFLVPFDIRCLDVLVLCVLFFAHSPCIVNVIYNSPRQMYWCDWICFLFPFSFMSPVSLLLLLLLLVVMVGLKQMKKHQIKTMHTHTPCTRSCRRRQSRREKNQLNYIAYIKRKH